MVFVPIMRSISWFFFELFAFNSVLFVECARFLIVELLFWHPTSPNPSWFIQSDSYLTAFVRFATPIEIPFGHVSPLFGFHLTSTIVHYYFYSTNKDNFRHKQSANKRISTLVCFFISVARAAFFRSSGRYAFSRFNYENFIFLWCAERATIETISFHFLPITPFKTNNWCRKLQRKTASQIANRNYNKIISDEMITD